MEFSVSHHKFRTQLCFFIFHESSKSDRDCSLFFKLWILPTYAKRGADYPISCLDSSKSNFGRWVSIGKCNFFTTVHNVYSINSEILWECCARRCSRKINQMKLGNCDLYERYQSVSINFMPSAHTIFQLHFLGVIQSEVWNDFKIPIFFRPCKKNLLI